MNVSFFSCAVLPVLCVMLTSPAQAWTCEVGPELLGNNHVRYGATCRILMFSASHYTFLKALQSYEDLLLVAMDTHYSPMIAQ